MSVACIEACFDGPRRDLVADWCVCSPRAVLAARADGGYHALDELSLRSLDGVVANSEAVLTQGVSVGGVEWVIVQQAGENPAVLLPKSLRNRKARTLVVVPMSQGCVAALFKAGPQAAIACMAEALSSE